MPNIIIPPKSNRKSKKPPAGLAENALLYSNRPSAANAVLRPHFLAKNIHSAIWPIKKKAKFAYAIESLFGPNKKVKKVPSIGITHPLKTLPFCMKYSFVA